MEAGTDFYPLLESFAELEKTTAVEFEALRAFLERQVFPGGPRYTLPLIRTELDALVEEGRVAVSSKDGQTFVFLPELCRREILRHYETIAEMKESPFPTEQNMGFKIPDDFTLDIDLDIDIDRYLAEDVHDADAIIRITSSGETIAFALPGMVPQKLAEAALYKLSFYLSNKDVKYYIYQKLLPQFRGKESYASGSLDQIHETPLKCYVDIEQGDEAVYFFWAVLCDFIKRDSGETGSHTSRETSAAKAAAILSPIVGHFREIKAKAAQKEHGFREIVNCLNDPPYFYNMESILAFKTETGESLVELCGKEDFDDWLARQMMPVGDEMIPAIISFSGYDGSKFYVTKERFLLMIAQKVLETRGIVRYIIVQRWSRIIKAWQTEPAMDSDKEFDLLIHRIVRRRNHVLASLLTDPRLILAYHETAKTKDNAPGIKMLFGKEGLNPAPEIFDLDRAALLKETKAALPLRYTNKYLRAIFMFFSRLFNKKSDEEPEIEDNSEELKNESSREAALHALESALVPEEYTLDDYLDTLELRWNQIADGRRRKTSRNDVDTLIRNRVMGILGSRKRRVLTMDEISSAAQDIIDFSPSFQKIPGKKDLKAYVQVSMLKAMRCVSRKQ